MGSTDYVKTAGGDDADGDGIPDLEEDQNGNGLVDIGETDFNNPDTDGDGIWDSVERGYQAGNPGDPTYDVDPSTLTDPLIADTDGDNGWNGYSGLDGEEDANHNGKIDTGETDPLFSIVDRDGDGFTVTQDCNDNPLDDPTTCSSDPTYSGCAKNINPIASEVCGDGIDNDCDTNIDEGCGYSAVANAEAAVYGTRSLAASGSFNALGLLLIPVGAVIFLRVLRRKR